MYFALYSVMSAKVQLGQEGKQHGFISGYTSDHRADLQNLVLDLLFALARAHFVAISSNSSPLSAPATSTLTATNPSSRQLSTSVPTMRPSGAKFAMLSLHPPRPRNLLPLPSNEPLLKALRLPSRRLSVPHRRFNERKEQTEKILDQARLYELRGLIFRDVDGFFKKKTISRGNHGPAVQEHLPVGQAKTC